MYTVYAHVTPSGKIYIGITSVKPEYRWGPNGNRYKKNKHFWFAIKKYGWDNISHEIIKDNLEPDEAYKLEVELIAKYKSNNPEYGYNQSLGGESGSLGVKHSEETKKNMSKAFKGRIYSKEAVEKSSEAKRKPVLQFDLLDNFIKRFTSVTEASQETNTGKSNIIYTCKGTRKTCGGFKWKYEETT